MDHVEITAQRFHICDLNSDEFALAELVGDGDLGKEAKAQFAFDHSFRGFDGFDFHHDVGEEARAAEQALREGPIARAAIEENQGPGFEFFHADFALAGHLMAGMSDED